MLVPISWLKEYVDIKESEEQLSFDLTLAGTKVEAIKKENGENILEFEITPNRPDCLGILGIAREVAAIYGRQVTIPAVFDETRVKQTTSEIRFEITDSKLCPAYTFGLIENIKVGESEIWLKKRLENAGIRSINNVVDITNYVMLETGQPMHAFDFNKITGKMRLRFSKKGEEITTLDDDKRLLPDGAIVIEDDKELIDLAGLMGGKSSDIDQNTTKILFLVPIYDPVAIRHTSQNLGLRTESSTRFEKNLSYGTLRFAFERAANLLIDLAGGQIIFIESKIPSDKELSINLKKASVNDSLGLNLTVVQIKEILEKLEFGTRVSGESLTVIVPTFRTDIEKEIDLVEEVGRIYGYNNIPKKLPSGEIPIDEAKNKNIETTIKEALALLGLSEIYGNPLVSAQDINDQGFKIEECLKISNRLLADFEYLRPSLLISLLSAAFVNIRNFEYFSLFEVGRVFSKELVNGLPAQPKKVAALFVGSSLRDAKGILETFSRKTGIEKISFNKGEAGKSFEFILEVSSKSEKLGYFGQVDSAIAKKFDIKTPVFFFELDIAQISDSLTPKTYKILPKYPLVKEYFSVFLPEGFEYQNVAAAISEGAGKYLYEASLKEDKTVSGKRSILIETTYFSETGTLEKGTIQNIRTKILEKIKQTGAIPRVD